MRHRQFLSITAVVASVLAIGAGPTASTAHGTMPVAPFMPSERWTLAQFGTDPSPGGGGGSYDEPSSDGNRDSASSERRSGPTIVSARAPASNAATNVITARLREVEQNCEKLPELYSVDCVAVELKELVRQLPNRGDYAAARAALDRVSREIDTIARQSRDRAQPRVRLNVRRTGESRARRTAPIAAVTPASLPRAKAQATAAVQRAQQTLLRSVASNDPRRVHYQRIAAAFDSTAVLLRS